HVSLRLQDPTAPSPSLVAEFRSPAPPSSARDPLLRPRPPPPPLLLPLLRTSNPPPPLRDPSFRVSRTEEEEEQQLGLPKLRALGSLGFPVQSLLRSRSRDSMVLISEITDEVPKAEGDGAPDPKVEQSDDAEPTLAAADTTAQDTDPIESEQTQPRPPTPTQEPLPLPEQQEQPPLPQDTPPEPSGINPPPPPPPSSSSAPPDDSQLAAPAPPSLSAPVKVPYNEYALRVAYIMRSYLHMRPGSATSHAPPASAADGEDRCRATMEVTRRENGRWGVSKIELEHTHPLDPPPDPAGTLAAGRLVPVVGMEFDSISAAKQYYNAYSEKMGFQSKMGSGKRSRGTRLLIMQRFSCSKGHFPTYNNAAENSTKKRKRGTYRKRTEKEAEEAKKDGNAVEVIQLESSTDKEGMAVDEQRPEVQSGRPETSDAGKTLSSSVNEKGKGKDVGKVPLVSNPGQSRLLRELGIRVSRYTHEERRNIILKYMQKRSGRQAVDRSIKVTL
ncbi:hypothetical protein GW17_00047085, partial [Ensete ventricosum]